MGRYILRRLLQQIPIIIGVSILVFAIIQIAPGNPLASYTQDPNMTKEAMEALKEAYGLNKHPVIQYLEYMKNAVQGNFGYSIQLKQPVAKLIAERLWPTFYVAFASLLLSVLIAVPIGVISATKQYSLFDYAGTIFALAGISIPSFFFALLLKKWLAIDLRMFPLSGLMTPGKNYVGINKLMDLFNHTFIPLIVLGLSGAGGLMRYTRSSMLEVIRQDYIRTARAKGLREMVVVYKHALRNALIPVITLLGFTLPTLFSGAVITETMFALPGLGRLQHQAVIQRDYPIMMGTNLFLALFTLLGNLLADISYAAVDPRIRLD
jgi:peptide/nickel transport system permease protein